MKEVARGETIEKKKKMVFETNWPPTKKQTSVNAQKHVKALKMDGTMQTKVF